MTARRVITRPCGFTAADADREIARADAGIFETAESILDQPVFQRMKGDDAEPAAMFQQMRALWPAASRGGQFLVDFDPDSLEGPAGRMLGFLAAGAGMALRTSSASSVVVRKGWRLR